MRSFMVAGNWKMNTTLEEGRVLAETISSSAANAKVKVLICPPYTHLNLLADVLFGSPVLLGAQNASAQLKGAYTGEVAVDMLKGLCEYVILGHSERRQYFAESDELVNQKARTVLGAGLTPIVCVGEMLETRQSGQHLSYVTASVRASLQDLPVSTANLVLAYEPVWAIGTGLAATPEQANEVIVAIRETVSAMYGAEIAAQILILYGGSSTDENVSTFLSYPDIDGFLVGGASLKADKFSKMIELSNSRG